MINGLLLLFSLVLAGAGLLTVVKSPIWCHWQVAVLAGEYGHWLAGVALTIGLVAGARWNDFDSPLAVIFALNALAMGMLLKPSVQAWSMGRTLPDRLERAWGPVSLSRPVFSFVRLASRAPGRIAHETLTYGEGLSLDFYRCEARPNAPCVVMIHGGGWDSGDKGQLPHFNPWLAQRGYAVAAISYRLAPRFKWPAQRDDILAAIAFLRSQAGALGIDASRLVLLGRSAGGNLAETVAYTARDPGVRGVVALYAPADLNFAWNSPGKNDPLNSPLLMRQFLGGAPENVPAAFASSSGINFVDENTPPTLLLHGRLDPLVWHRQSERLAARLEAAGVPHVYVSLPWATHAFEFNLNGPGGQVTTFALEWFLAAVTK